MQWQHLRRPSGCIPRTFLIPAARDNHAACHLSSVRREKKINPSEEDLSYLKGEADRPEENLGFQTGGFSWVSSRRWQPSFRQAYDQLVRADERKADRAYLTLLTLAAERGEDEVAAAIGVVLRAVGVPWPEAIVAALGPRETATPVLAAFTPELHSYDALITEVSA